MLNERFLDRLADAFPQFYARVNGEAFEEAERLRAATDGDVEKALARARLEGAAKLWWPYVEGSVPLLHRDRAAMEGFTRLVLTVDHLVGYDPGSMEVAREQVVGVLRSSLDYERLKSIVTRDSRKEAATAAASAGFMASVGALMTPIKVVRNARAAIRWVPGWGRVAVGAIVVAALASVPVVAGYSAGRQAEKSARSHHVVSPSGDGRTATTDVKRVA